MRLLLAEDERELSRALVTILEHSSYTVDAVYNGADALDYLRSGLYDGAILDIMMPQMDGLTVLRTAREEGISLPVLLLTAKGEVDDRVAGLDSGADDYLPKPFSTKELLARLRAMLRRTPGNAPADNRLTFGNLSLDLSVCELSTDEGSIRLANKDFQMMELLLRNPGRVISADRFMEKIWESESDSGINVVWVYVSNLRKKLASLGSDAEIRTARGLGYYLAKQPGD